ncbi:MAG: hypothetical protein KME63_07295 [Candidatus Thiodiazotropha sp. (ex Clathrolucina costata)]|nr:hypothetical protein [Candidatus Thiodiazotropha taylori]
MSEEKPDPDRPIKVGDILMLGRISDGAELLDDPEIQKFIQEHVDLVLNVTLEELLRIGVTDPDCLVIRMANQNTSNEQRLKDLRNKYFEKTLSDKSMNRIH